jgi:hypothetical protein
MKMVWKPEHAEARKARAKADPEYRKRRNAQAVSNPDARKEYMREYYKANPDKFKRITPEQRAERNAKRRERYAVDAEWRAAHKASVKDWQASNPDKRKSQRLKAHGIELSDYQDMLAMQKGRCAICGYSDMSKPNFFPVVDHCHKTGIIRGLLCMNCNQGLGKFKDDVNALMGAAAYIAKHG